MNELKLSGIGNFAWYRYRNLEKFWYQ